VTVEFALFLSPEGIALAHRQTAGHWALIAEAPLDGDDLDAAMAGLKAAATARGGEKAPVLLVLPDDQVLYTSFTAPADNPALVEERITEGLEGMTPYPVTELSFDWRAIEDDRVKVAVVAKETLGEATEFAATHGFEAAGFAAMPPAERFPAMPLFGETRGDWGLDGSGMAFGADTWVDPATRAKPAPDPAAAEAVDTAQPDPEAPEDADQATSDAAPDKGTDTGADTGPEPEAKAAEDAVHAPPEAEASDAPAGADAVDAPPGADAVPAPDRPDSRSGATEDAPEPPKADAQATAPPPDTWVPEDAAADDDTLTPIEDPTLDHPIAPLATDEDDERAPVEDATTAPQPPKAKSAPVAPDLSDMPDTPDEADTAEAPDAPPAPTATRGKVERAPARPLSVDQPAAMPPRPTRSFGSATPTPGAAPEEEPGDAAPTLGFSARRGKAAKPDGGSGDLVSSRRSRLGFGTNAGDSAAPILHPDAAPSTASAPPPPAKPGGKLAAQLARVRDASKTRAKPPEASPVPAKGLGTRAEASSETARPSEAAMPREATPAPAPAKADPGGGFGFSRRRGASAAQKPPPARGGAPNGGDTAFTSGLLMRKPVEPSGPSFRTGLILTVVLLVLLALIAVWSVLFLPDSPMARLFTGGSERSVATTADDPFEAPVPPTAITAPPAIFSRDTGGVELEMPAQDPAIEEAAAANEAPEVAEADSAEAGRDDVLAEALAISEAAQADATLPDIDAELDLPPLPPLPEESLPSLEETERIYAEDGIWPRPPERPSIGPLGSVDDLYVASIDPDVPSMDAIALAAPGLDPSERLRQVPPPPPFGEIPERDARGLIQATPEGVLTPEGAFVVLGRPAVDAIPRPREIAPVADPAPEAEDEAEDDEALLDIVSPLQRPADLEETRQRQVQGGFSTSELAGLRPDPRPQSAQEAAAQASLFTQGDAVAEALAEAAETAPAEAAPVEVASTALAVAASRVPPLRPATIATIAAAAAENTGPAVAAEAVARAPSIPSSADVTRAATERNAIRLRDVNLIGVTGTPSDRRALVRLPSGRFVRVGVGDRLDGGTVAAIGEASLQYVRNGRNVTLEIPG